MDGAFFVASSKSNRSVRSASPWYFPRQSAPFRAKNVTCLSASFAQTPARARTTSVLPVPGSPCSRSPRGGCRWRSRRTPP